MNGAASSCATGRLDASMQDGELRGIEDEDHAYSAGTEADVTGVPSRGNVKEEMRKLRHSYCDTANAVPTVAKKNPSAASFARHSHDIV